jgi:hypothetical protein
MTANLHWPRRTHNDLMRFHAVCIRKEPLSDCGAQPETPGDCRFDTGSVTLLQGKSPHAIEMRLGGGPVPGVDELATDALGEVSELSTFQVPDAAMMLGRLTGSPSRLLEAAFECGSIIDE